MSDHLIAEANRHAQALPRMQLPTTQPTHRDIAWYAEECADLKKQLAAEIEAKRKHLHIACEEINHLKVRAEFFEREIARLRAAKNLQGLHLATMADVVLGEDAVDRSDETLVREVCRLTRENAALRESATRLIQNNGGPLQSDEAVECDRQDDYIMVKVQDFEVLCAAIDAARKEQSK